jgi:hypothetical protein
MIRDLIIKNKTSIVNNWIKSVYETYPSETSNFLKDQKNRFSNPVGYSISQCGEKILDELTGDFNLQQIRPLLQDLIKIRAVQDFSPSHAIGIIFFLKNSIDTILGNEIKNKDFCNELMSVNSQIDQIVLSAFDLYMEAREKLFQIRVAEIKSRSRNIVD